MINIYNVVLFQPLLNLMIGLYNLIGDMGVAIIIVTIIISLLLIPLSLKSMKSQQALQELQPKMDEIKAQYKDDKKKQSEALMGFYKKNKVNPLSSCLPIIIQLPIIFALYGVFRQGLTQGNMDMLYSFVHQPEHINQMFLHFINVTKPNVFLAFLAGIFQFLQSKMVFVKPKDGKQNTMTSMMSKQMTYFMPVMTVFIAISLPAGLALYWVTTTLFSMAQQYIIKKKTGKTGLAM